MLRLLWAWSGFPKPLQPWVIFLLSQLRGPKEVSLNWFLCSKSIREPNSVEDNPLPGQGNTICKVGVGPESQLTRDYWAHTPFSTSDLLNWEHLNPSYRNDHTEITDLVMLIFATYRPSWANIQGLLNILLMGDEQRLILDRQMKRLVGDCTRKIQMGFPTLLRQYL